jgi:hypothetical protein
VRDCIGQIDHLPDDRLALVAEELGEDGSLATVSENGGAIVVGLAHGDDPTEGTSSVEQRAGLARKCEFSQLTDRADLRPAGATAGPSLR